LYNPGAALELAVIVSVEVPEPVTELLVRVAVSPAGAVWLRDTTPAKLPIEVTVMVELAFAPETIVTPVGLAAIIKSGGMGLTVSGSHVLVARLLFASPL
jgi:hypothetical protein